jgi:iron complex outermembrane receptor protein
MTAPRLLRPTPLFAACAVLCASLAAHAQQAATLQPVVVSGSGFEQRAFDAPFSVGIVDARELSSGGLMVNLSEAMARIPGITVNNRNNYAQDQQISSRGFGARSSFGVRGMRLYTDGIPATMPDGSGQVSHFDLAGAQRIEVLRGPFSALYGNSSGGVISLVSEPVKDRYAEIDLDAGRYGTRQVRATVQAPLSDTPGRGFDIRASISRFETDGFRPQSEAERTSGNVRLGWTGERDKVVVSFSHTDQPALDPLGLNYADFQADPYQTVVGALPQESAGIVDPARFNTRKNLKQDQLGASWRHRFEGLGALSESAVVAYAGQRSVTQWQAITTGAQAAATSPGGVIDFDRDYRGIDGRLVWRWQLEGERSAQIVAGAAFEESEEDRRGYRNYIDTPDGRVLGVTGELRRDEKNKVNTKDVYVQGEIEFVKNWVATLGVRSGKVDFTSDDRFIQGTNLDDSGSLDYNYTNPVAALQWRVSPELNVYLSGGRGFESPTLAELAYRPDSQPGVNTDLKAQESKQVELGAKWRPAGTGLAVDAALFEARTDNELGVATNRGGRSTFQNVGKTTRKGAELSAGWQPTTQWSAALALTFLSAEYDNGFETCYGLPAPCTAATTKNQVPAGTRIAGTSPRSAYAELAWRPFGNLATEFAAEWRAQDRVATNDLNAAGAVDDFTAGWATLGLRARQQYAVGPQSRLEILARLDNVFDREYAGSAIVNEGNRRFFEAGAPRSWLLGVKWRQAF